MKKPVFFAFILFISCIPVAGKSNDNECSTEKNVRPEQLIGDDVTNDDPPTAEAESLITRFIYTF